MGKCRLPIQVMTCYPIRKKERKRKYRTKTTWLNGIRKRAKHLMFDTCYEASKSPKEVFES